MMDESDASGRTRWRVLGLTWAALTMASVVRIALPVTAPTLAKEYELSPVTLGYVISGWNWAYTACQLVVGPLVDHFGPWIVLGTGAGIWSLSTLLLPLATGWVTLFLLRAGFGVGHSMLIPAQGSAVSRWFKPQQRSTALGIGFSGSQVGIALGSTVCGLILAGMGWRAVFYWVGAANVLLAIIWFSLYPDKRIGPQVKTGTGDNRESSLRVSITALLRHRSAWGLAFGQMGYLYAYHVFVGWLPTYLMTERGMSIVSAGVVTGLPFWVGMIGTIGGGWLGDFLIRLGLSATVARKSVVGVGMILATFLVVGAAYTPQTWLAVLLLTLCMGSLRATTGSANAMPLELAPKASVASLVSIQNFGGNVGGLIAPIATGYIMYYTGTLSGALVAAGAVMTFGAFSYIFIVGKLPDADRG